MTQKLKKQKKIKVVELFAGVGGFRLGLKKASETFDFVFTNQWEPGKKVQHASDCYVRRFGEKNHYCNDIAEIKDKVPQHDLLVGGFPCQDYSVATTNAQGLHGKKGVLWWEINHIVEKQNPKFILLENVDRLLRSPTKQRGRDFGIILWCLNKLGYLVEWRVINAAEYGFPQKRRRTFIFAVKKDSKIGKQLSKDVKRIEYLSALGFFSKGFEATREILDLSSDKNEPVSKLPKGIQKVSDDFALHFFNSGVMLDGEIWTSKLKATPSKITPLKDILEKDVDDKYFVPQKDLPVWRELKGAKSQERTTKTGFKYHYSEGKMAFPEDLSKPGRTILTGEGGLSPSRFKHIILDPQVNRYRVLTPVEVEKMNGFNKNWTEGMPEKMRYFCMGNALVVGLIEKIGTIIADLEIKK